MNEQNSKDRDVDLMERLKNGDQSAMQVLYARHYQRIYRFILRQIKDETMAEDIVNEVFLDCWRSAGKFEGRSSVTTWLTAISYNKSISYLRKRREAQMGDGQAEAMVDDADSPQIELMKGDKGDQLRYAISKLSETHAAVIDLAYYHEMSINEIAEVLDVPANTIKTRLFHARKNLHEILCDAGVDRGWP
ncbi:MAG: sigma-70 family RNA polymerase sigma factor [Hyphomicrobiales bacterium]